MFAVKIFNNKKDRDNVFNKSVQSIINYVRGGLKKQVSVITDSNCVEFFSKEDSIDLSGEIVAELLIKKRVVINIKDLNDKARLDKYMSEIKQFCEKAAAVEDIKYIPINYRQRENLFKEDEET